MTRGRLASIRNLALAGFALVCGCARTPVEPVAKIDGEAAYRANCLACHQADGRGVPFFQPPLVDGTWVRGDPQALAAFVLTGGFNSAERKDAPNENVMPAFTQLDDATLAAVLTYIRARFGSDAGAVTPEVVAQARATIAK
jgi:mono/diheme cytochrome c family protein